MVIKSDKTLSPFAAPAEPRSSLRQALPQILAVCVKNVLLLGFGMTLGFPTILIPSLSGSDPKEKISLGQEAISWIGSINLICVPVGAILSGVITQPIGRKRAMQLVNIPFLLAWLLFHFSNDVWQIFLALCITGFSGGLLEAPTLTYVAEITEPRLRGILATTSGIAVILGILLEFILGSFFAFRTVAIISSVVPVISFLLLFLPPESPYWLLLKNRQEEAKKSLAWLRGWLPTEEVESEFNQLNLQFAKETHENSFSMIEKMKLFKEKKFLWPFLLVSFTFFLSQFCGISPVQIYAVNIFKTINAPIDEYYATVAMGVGDVLGCILSASVVHYSGKRILNFLSLSSCGICFLIIGVYSQIYGVFYLKNFSPHSVIAFEDDGNQNNEHTWLPTTFIIGAAFCSHLGTKHLPWMLIGEVYANDIRSTASGFSGATLTYVAEITQPSLRGILGSTSTIAVILGILIQFILGTFLHWRTVALLSSIAPLISFILYFFVPESPHWLIAKNRFLDARKSLAWLRGWLDVKDIENEFKELSKQILKSDSEESDEKVCSGLKLFAEKSFYWPFFLVCLCFFLGHFSGMSTLQTYAVQIFSSLQAPIDKYYATIMLGIAEVLGCTLSAFLIHFLGKRIMNFFSLIGTGMCFLIVAIYAYSKEIHYLDLEFHNSAQNSWVPTTFLIGSAFFTHAGIRILPWMLIGEVFHTEIRSTASGLCGAASYIFNFVANKIFLNMTSAITLPGTFWFYSAICFVGAIALYFVLPETEGKTLFVIIEHFAGNDKIGNKVHRERKKEHPLGKVNEGFRGEDGGTYKITESKF